MEPIATGANALPLWSSDVTDASSASPAWARLEEKIFAGGKPYRLRGGAKKRRREVPDDDIDKGVDAVAKAKRMATEKKGSGRDKEKKDGNGKACRLRKYGDAAMSNSGSRENSAKHLRRKVKQEESEPQSLRYVLAERPREMHNTKPPASEGPERLHDGSGKPKVAKKRPRSETRTECSSKVPKVKFKVSAPCQSTSQNEKDRREGVDSVCKPNKLKLTTAMDLSGKEHLSTNSIIASVLPSHKARVSAFEVEGTEEESRKRPMQGEARNSHFQKSKKSESLAEGCATSSPEENAAGRKIRHATKTRTSGNIFRLRKDGPTKERGGNDAVENSSHGKYLDRDTFSKQDDIPESKQPPKKGVLECMSLSESFSQKPDDDAMIPAHLKRLGRKAVAKTKTNDGIVAVPRSAVLVTEQIQTEKDPKV